MSNGEWALLGKLPPTTMSTTIKFDYCLLFLFLSRSDVSIDIYCSLEYLLCRSHTSIIFVYTTQTPHDDCYTSVVRTLETKHTYSLSQQEETRPSAPGMSNPFMESTS